MLPSESGIDQQHAARMHFAPQKHTHKSGSQTKHHHGTDEICVGAIIDRHHFVASLIPNLDRSTYHELGLPVGSPLVSGQPAHVAGRPKMPLPLSHLSRLLLSEYCTD